jgi:hypothetical protein
MKSMDANTAQSTPRIEFGRSWLSSDSISAFDKKVKIATRLREADLGSISAEALREDLLKLLDGYLILGVPRSAQQVWYRARKAKTEEGYACLTELVYPKGGNTSYGRANLPGSSAMYGSLSIPTVFDEKDVEQGDIVQTITFRPIVGSMVPCHIVGNYRSFHNCGRCLIHDPKTEAILGQMQAKVPDAFLSAVFVDSFLAEFFGRINTVSYNYKLSAVYAELLMTNGGVIFPSVKNPGGMNLAIPSALFDSTFEVITTEVFKVQNAWGYGLYAPKPLRRSCDFDTDGNIDWKSTKNRMARWSPQGGIEFDSAPGWRVGSTQDEK